MKTLFCCLLSLIATVASTAALDLDSLLRASVGGQPAYEALRQIESYRLTGRVSLNEQMGSFVFFFAAPDRVRLEVRFGSLTQAQGYDGRTAWQRDFNGAVSELSGADAREVWRQAYLQSYAYLLPERMPGEVRYVGDTVVDHTPVFRLELYPLRRDTITMYLDKKTALPVETVGFMDKIEIHTRFDDYRQVRHILVPFHTVSTAVSFPYRSEMWLDSVQLDVPVADSLFSTNWGQPMDFRFPAGGTQTVLPFILRDGHVYIKVTINGSHRFVFILDTGASMNFLHTAVVDALGLAAVGELPGSGMAGDRRIPLVPTDSLQIGKLTLYHQVAGELDLSLFETTVDSLPFGGLIGYDFLSRFPVMIDFNKRTLTVFRRDSFIPPLGGFTLPMRFYRQVPVVPATVEGITGDFIIDLGNPRGIILHDEFVRRHGLLQRWGDRVKTGGDISGVGGSLGVRSVIVDSFALGGFTGTQVPVLLTAAGGGITASRELAGNIGGPFLQQFRILLDYEQQEIRLYPGE